MAADWVTAMAVATPADSADVSVQLDPLLRGLCHVLEVTYVYYQQLYNLPLFLEYSA